MPALRARRILAITSLAVAVLVGCGDAPEGVPLEERLEASAREAAERAEKEARRAAGQLEREASRASRELGREAGKAAEVLQEKATDAADGLRGNLEQIGETVEVKARAAGARVGPQVERAIDDAAITTRVKAKLVADPETSPFAMKIEVETTAGVVRLVGRVDSEAVRAEALKHARQTAGVVEVVDLLRVGEAPLPAERTP